MSGDQVSIELHAWKRIASDDDGVLPDGVVTDTSQHDWEQVLAALEERGWASALETDADLFVLQVRPSSDVLVILRRYVWSSVDFDFDLRELTTQEALNQFCDVVRVIGRAARKDVVLYPEGASGSVAPYATYSHVHDRFELAE